MLSALHTITTYPFDRGGPIFAHYPAMKFGQAESVAFFGELLAQLASKIIEDGPADGADWVLTSPPLQGLPCGANLVCRAVRDHLAGILPGKPGLHLVSMDVKGARRPISNHAEFQTYHEYSKSDLTRRRQCQLARHERATYDLTAFVGRHTVFVNDINVTGTQLSRISKLLGRAGVKSLDVILIVNVDPGIGCAYPQLEHEINTSRIASLPDFIAFLRDCDFVPTGKLISRLMSHDDRTFATVFEALQPPKRQVLHRAILQEGLYESPLFNEKTQIAERFLSEG